MWLRALIIYVCFVVVAAKKAEFPKEILERCEKSDPHIDDCLKKAVQKALPKLSKGIPRVSILPIDPMHTPQVVMEQYYGPVTINVSFTDVYTRGYSNMTVTRIKSRLSKMELEAFVKSPRLILDGKYDVKANIFLLPIEGTGTFKITFEDITGQVKLLGDKLQRGGFDYMRLKRTPVTFQPRSIHFELKNLFGGNEKLGEHANNFLNRHSLDVYSALQPVVQDAVSEIIKGAAVPFFGRVPYDEIFL